jgi:hypothetical protein
LIQVGLSDHARKTQPAFFYESTLARFFICSFVFSFIIRCVSLERLQTMENKRTRELSEEELTVLRQEVDKYTTEGDLVRGTFSALTRHNW